MFYFRFTYVDYDVHWHEFNVGCLGIRIGCHKHYCCLDTVVGRCRLRSKDVNKKGDILWWLIVIVMMIAFVLLFTPSAHGQEVPTYCPEGYEPVAKWETDRWDPGSGFESGFEFGSDWIAIDLVGADDEGEVNRLVFVVLKGPIYLAIVKGGLDVEVYDYSANPLNPDSSIPPMTYQVESYDKAISNVLWCTARPTAVTLTTFAEYPDETNTVPVWLAVLVLGGITAVFLLFQYMGRRGK